MKFAIADLRGPIADGIIWWLERILSELNNGFMNDYDGMFEVVKLNEYKEQLE